MYMCPHMHLPCLTSWAFLPHHPAIQQSHLCLYISARHELPHAGQHSKHGTGSTVAMLPAGFRKFRSVWDAVDVGPALWSAEGQYLAVGEGSVPNNFSSYSVVHATTGQVMMPRDRPGNMELVWLVMGRNAASLGPLQSSGVPPLARCWSSPALGQAGPLLQRTVCGTQQGSH